MSKSKTVSVLARKGHEEVGNYFPQFKIHQFTFELRFIETTSTPTLDSSL